MTTKTFTPCAYCGENISAHAFICPNCGKPQPGSVNQKFADSTTTTVPRTQGKNIIDVTAHFDPSEQSGPPVSQSLRGSGRKKIDVAVITFSDNARIQTAPTPVHEVDTLYLEPDSGTNYKAAFKEALSLCHGYGRVLVLVEGDGGANVGGGFLSNPEEAAFKAAQELKDCGARIAVIGFDGATHNPDFLRGLASGPSLWEVTYSGQVQQSFVSATTTLTNGPRAGSGKTLFIYIIDESGSMSEGNKQQEVEAAFRSSLQVLKQMC